jgi:hypothetical protein
MEERDVPPRSHLNQKLLQSTRSFRELEPIQPFLATTANAANEIPSM